MNWSKVNATPTPFYLQVSLTLHNYLDLPFHQGVQGLTMGKRGIGKVIIEGDRTAIQEIGAIPNWPSFFFVSNPLF